MDAVFFFYTYCLIAVLLFASATSAVLWMISHSRTAACAAAVFAAYIAELALILFDEYTHLKVANPAIFENPLAHPLEHLALSVVFVFACWAWVLARTYSSRYALKAMMALSVWAAIDIVLLPRTDESGVIDQYLYWLWRDASLIGCAIFGFVRMHCERDETIRSDLARLKRFGVATLILTLAMVVEDTIVILFHRPDSGSEFLMQLSWHLAGRNISENVLVAFWAISVLRGNYREFQLYVKHPPLIPDESSGSSVEENLAFRIELYCDLHGLSSRERDVVRLVLSGKDIKNAARDLFISPGTVRAHLHRIYRKVGVSSKEELVADFWDTPSR